MLLRQSASIAAVTPPSIRAMTRIVSALDWADALAEVGVFSQSQNTNASKAPPTNTTKAHKMAQNFPDLGLK